MNWLASDEGNLPKRPAELSLVEEDEGLEIPGHRLNWVDLLRHHPDEIVPHGNSAAKGSHTLLNSPDTRLRGLDGLRGLAILMVLLWHYGSLELTSLENPKLILLHESLSLMWSGVDLFFVLSGFLITRILLETCRAENYWSVFYLRRACRILPLYGVLLLAYGVALSLHCDEVAEYGWLFRNPMPVMSYATFTQNLFMGVKHAFGANLLASTWSLAVEEQFYLFLPILIFRIPHVRLPIVFILGCIIPPMCRFYFPGYSVLMATPFKVDPLCYGGLVALIYRSPAAFQFAREHLKEIELFFALLCLMSLALTFHLGPLTTHFILFGSFSSITFSAVALLYTSLLLLLLLKPEASLFRPLHQKWLTWLGEVSFFTYLFHQGLSGILHLCLGGYKPTADTPKGALVTLTALLITLTFAELSRRFLEKPILAWGRSFAYRYSDQPEGSETNKNRAQET